MSGGRILPEPGGISQACAQGETTPSPTRTGKISRLPLNKGRWSVIQGDGVHTPYRQYQKAGGDPTCPHCRAAACDWEHILWKCPHYRTAAGTLSGAVRTAWQEARGEPRCLWTLGHVPKGWAPDPSSAQMRQQHSLRVGVYDPNGPKVRGGTDGGAVKTATSMRAGLRCP